MTPQTLTPLLDLPDLAGVFVFALTGALIAARERQTIVTMCFFALLTGVGGGTVRDLLIDAPVFWVRHPWYATICLIAAPIAWIAPMRMWRGRLLDYLDGAGLTSYAVLGAAKALSYGIAPIPAMLMGVITGCAGGIIRDGLAGRPSILIGSEIYVTAAALSAALCVVGNLADLPRIPVWVIAGLAGFALRSAAIHWQLALPAYGDGPRAGDHTPGSGSSDAP